MIEPYLLAAAIDGPAAVLTNQRKTSISVNIDDFSFFCSTYEAQLARRSPTAAAAQLNNGEKFKVKKKKKNKFEQTNG